MLSVVNFFLTFDKANFNRLFDLVFIFIDPGVRCWLGPTSHLRVFRFIFFFKFM